MTGSPKMRRLRALAIGAAVVTAALVTPSSPASAAPGDSDALIFVPFNGQTATIWRNGNLTTPTNVSAELPFQGDFSSACLRI